MKDHKYDSEKIINLGILPFNPLEIKYDESWAPKNKYFRMIMFHKNHLLYKEV